mmetsp:Transcript_37501/g.120714  ORF Transcript_37501/g.120714 Transcript_37501/m.120714 type:complete len:579 (-) Transcript_37501:294-2030(-)
MSLSDVFASIAAAQLCSAERKFLRRVATEAAAGGLPAAPREALAQFEQLIAGAAGVLGPGCGISFIRKVLSKGGHSVLARQVSLLHQGRRYHAHPHPTLVLEVVLALRASLPVDRGPSAAACGASSWESELGGNFSSGADVELSSCDGSGDAALAKPDVFYIGEGREAASQTDAYSVTSLESAGGGLFFSSGTEVSTQTACDLSNMVMLNAVQLGLLIKDGHSKFLCNLEVDQALASCCDDDGDGDDVIEQFCSLLVLEVGLDTGMDDKFDDEVSWPPGATSSCRAMARDVGKVVELSVAVMSATGDCSAGLGPVQGSSDFTQGGGQRPEPGNSSLLSDPSQVWLPVQQIEDDHSCMIFDKFSGTSVVDECDGEVAGCVVCVAEAPAAVSSCNQAVVGDSVVLHDVAAAGADSAAGGVSSLLGDEVPGVQLFLLGDACVSRVAKSVMWHPVGQMFGVLQLEASAELLHDFDDVGTAHSAAGDREVPGAQVSLLGVDVACAVEDLGGSCAIEADSIEKAIDEAGEQTVGGVASEVEVGMEVVASKAARRRNARRHRPWNCCMSNRCCNFVPSRGRTTSG